MVTTTREKAEQIETQNEVEQTLSHHGIIFNGEN